MKKVLILLLSIFVLGGCSKKDNSQLLTSVNIKKNKAEYGEKIKLNDLVSIVNGSLERENIIIDTLTLGDKKISFKYKDNNKKINDYNFSIEIVDTTKPLLLHRSSYTIKKGSENNILSKIICGDNYDRSLECTINGNYDINTSGEYALKFLATDTSGNKTESPFKLIVKDDIPKSSSSQENFYLADFIKDYKTEKTLIGIDVSSWQGDIDWQAVKDAGIEFAMIRIGHGSNDDGTYSLDNKFYQNLEGAIKAKLKVGVYYYSKAISMEEAIKQADWIIQNLKGTPLDLPVAFDWESWSSFNDFHINYIDLNNTAASFMEKIKEHGYEAMNYGSASYLEKIWNLEAYPTWLAHYTKKTDYAKDYYLWQLYNTGIVPGINGNVDLDVLYLK